MSGFLNSGIVFSFKKPTTVLEKLNINRPILYIVPRYVAGSEKQMKNLLPRIRFGHLATGAHGKKKKKKDVSYL